MTQINITKVLALIAILGAFISVAEGWVDGKTAVAMIWAGLAVFGIRQSVSDMQAGRAGRF